MRRYKGSLLSCRKCKNRWILWTTQENFKKWNRITVRLSFVSSQPAMIPCSRSKLSRDERLPLDTGIHLDHKKTFLVINFLRLIHPYIILKEFFLPKCRENEVQFHKLQGQTMNLSSHVPTSSSSAKKSDCIQKFRDTHSYGFSKPDSI